MLLIQDTINQSLSLPSTNSSSILLTSSSSNDIHYVNSEVINYDVDERHKYAIYTMILCSIIYIIYQVQVQV